jgi:hypothetical protein
VTFNRCSTPPSVQAFPAKECAVYLGPGSHAHGHHAPKFLTKQERPPGRFLFVLSTFTRLRIICTAPEDEMILRIAILAASLMVAATGAHAEDSTALQVQLSSLLAAEDACSMTYDQDAIQRFIEKHVAADDLDFAATLPVMTRGQQVQVEQMTDSGKHAFCIQQTRAAKALGFTK